jgi:hypothetical protein
MQIGEWPFCPHGFPATRIHVISDELPNGPYWCETLGHEPVFVRSKSHLRREADARNLECVGGRKPDHYFATHRKQHMEKLRDEGQLR